MKNLTKKLMVFVLSLGLVLGVNTVAYAATYHSSDMQEGLYDVQTDVNPDLMNTYYKLSVVIEGGKVTTGSFELRTDGYPAAITVDFAAYAPDQTASDFITNTCPEVDDYSAQLISTGDGALVTKSSKAVADSNVYESFNTLWEQVVEQAGGTIVEDDAEVTETATANTTETTDTQTDVPKTGVESFALVYAGLAGIAGLGAAAFKNRNVK